MAIAWQAACQCERVVSHMPRCIVTCVSKACNTHVNMAPSYLWQAACQWEWVVSHMRICFVAHVNKACNTHVSNSRQMCGWVTSHVWMSHVTRLYESCHSWEWVMSHVWINYVARGDKSCYTSYKSEEVMPVGHMPVMCVTHVHESCQTYEWIVSHMLHVCRLLQAAPPRISVYLCCVCMCAWMRECVRVYVYTAECRSTGFW